MGELIIMLFHARTSAHIMHLRTKSKSYATHAALNIFYDEIVDLADTLAETYQGHAAVIESYPPHYTPYTDPIQLMTDLTEYIAENRYKILRKEDTYLQNIMDEIVGLIQQTLYKLKNSR